MPDQFVVELDMFHQLHCLNAIRKTLFPERYWNDFDDYYLPGVDEMGRVRRNYTSNNAKHYGKLPAPDIVHYSSLSPSVT
jgi:hypothetical protein